MKYSLFLLIVALFTSCTSAEEKSTIKHQAEMAVRADTIKASLRIEGMPESIQMYLLKSPKSFPIHFSTYIPVEMQTDTALFETGEAIHIIAAFGGHVNRDARLTIFAFSPQISEGKARSLAREKAGSPGVPPADSTQFAWAKTVYEINENRSGFLALARKENTWFYLMATYPPVYADGMGPRIAMILDKWRWTESGKSLH